VAACQADTCAAECSMVCGGWLFRKQSCEAYIQSNCCDLVMACASDVTCRTVEDCVQRCPAGHWGCYADCYAIGEQAADKDIKAYSCAHD